MQSPLEPPKEEENRATLLGCEAKVLVEEKTTKVSVLKEDKMKNMDNKSSNFCNKHVHLQPTETWEDGNTSLAYEDCKMKDNCEGVNPKSMHRRVILLMRNVFIDEKPLMKKA